MHARIKFNFIMFTRHSPQALGSNEEGLQCASFGQPALHHSHSTSTGQGLGQRCSTLCHAIGLMVVHQPAGSKSSGWVVRLVSGVRQRPLCGRSGCRDHWGWGWWVQGGCRGLPPGVKWNLVLFFLPCQWNLAYYPHDPACALTYAHSNSFQLMFHYVPSLYVLEKTLYPP